MSRHDIDIIIIKHWMVLHNTCLITSYLTGGEIRCITLYDGLMMPSARVCLKVVFRDSELPASTVELVFVSDLTHKVLGFLEIRQHILSQCHNLEPASVWAKFGLSGLK